MSFWKKDKKNMKGIAYRKIFLRLVNIFSSLKMMVKYPRRAVLSASMTLEAVFIFPLVLFFSVILIHVLNLVNYQNRINEIMYDTSRTLSKLEYVVEGSSNQATALTMLWADLRYGTSESVGVKGGNLGLVALKSDFGEDEVDFVINYIVKTPFDFLNVLDYSCCQRAYVRKWIGNEDKGDGSGELTDDDSMVYITENGTVYHLDRNCTHISLSIKKVSKSEIKNMRNVNGGKYYSCEICSKGAGGNTFYITDTGTKYHTNINCSGLKRAVYIVPLSQVIDWPKCSRCG